MDFDNYKIDKDKTWEALQEMMFQMMYEMLAQQETFVTTTNKVNELNPYITAIGKKILKIPMKDQIEFFNTLIQCGEVAKKLCEKNHIEIEEE